MSLFLLPGAKLAQKVDVNAALYEAIAASRGEQPAAKTVSACRAFQQLRAALHEPPTTDVTRRAIKRYLAALHFVLHTAKLPAELSVNLLWVNAFDASNHCALPDIRIDNVAALFNLAVCDATLATVAYRQRRTDSAAMKTTARHFQTAAGYFRAAAQHPLPGGVRAVTSDLYPPALHALQMVMLGNAQQVLYEIALDGGNSPAILARFAVGARDFYAIAEESCREPDVVNTCINAYVGRPAAALAAYFDVVAQSAMATACKDTHDMPQQLTRLAHAQTSLDTGLQTVKALDTTSLAAVTALRNALSLELEALKNSITQRRDDAEEENRTVYFMTPAPSVPEIVSRQSVKPADVQDVYTEEPVDERLLPFKDLPEPISPELSGVSSRYADMVKQTVADEVAAINTAAAHLREVVTQTEATIASQRAAAASEAAKAAPAPSSSLEEEQKAIDAVRRAQDSGGLGALRELQSQVISLAGEAKSQIQSIESLLQAEDAEDRQLRARVQVARRASVELTGAYWSKLQKIRGNLEQAANADLIVGGQIENFATAISQLDSVNVLDFTAPSAIAPAPQASKLSARIEAIVTEVDPEITSAKSRLLRKDDIVQEFEKKKHLENPYKTTSAISEGDAEVDQFSAIIEKEYGDLKRQARAACDEMSRISENLTDATARLQQPMQADEHPREEAQVRMNEIYKHQTAALKFAELMGHLRQGAEFYTKEQDNIVMLKKDIEGFVAARQAEANDLTNSQQGPGGGAPGFPPQGGFYPPSGNPYPQEGPTYPTNQANPSYSASPSIWRRH